MRSTFTITLFILLAVSQVSSQVPGGLHGQSDLTLDEASKDLITFGLKEISRTNKGFNGVEYCPVKILSKTLKLLLASTQN